MQRPPEARGQRSGYQRSGVNTNTSEFPHDGILEDIRSPLSQTQTKGRQEDDLGGRGSLGLNEHNFKSQTLQFQTNLGSDFINLFAPSEQGLAYDSSDQSENSEPDVADFPVQDRVQFHGPQQFL